MKAEDHKFDGRPQVDLLRHTVTGELESWELSLREPMEAIDGNGEIFLFPAWINLDLNLPLVSRRLPDRCNFSQPSHHGRVLQRFTGIFPRLHVGLQPFFS